MTRHFLLLAAGWLPGCALPSRLPINPIPPDTCVSTVCLEQPNCTGRQQKLDLTTAQTWWDADEKAERLLAELPLPGATSGNPMYLLYLRITPAMQPPGKTPVEYRARGFLIQTRGQFAGRVDTTEAKVTPTRVNSSRHEAELSLTLEDGSRLAGRVLAIENPQRLRRFESQERPADVESIK